MLQKNLPLRADETIVEIIKPSGVHHVGRALFGFCFISVNAFFTFWLWQKGLEGKIFYGLVWMLGLYLLLYGTLFHRSNYLIITTERIFDIHRDSLFNETLSALHFGDLADVVVEKRGLLASLLNFGLLTIHPKEGKFCFVVERVPKPAHIQNLLFERREAVNRTSRFKSKEEVYNRILKLIPEFSEAELTLLYQKIHSQLLNLAGTVAEKDSK